MIQTKNWLINEICKRHPSYGIARGMSEYVGGMRDTGEWYRWKMFNSYSKRELKEFLEDIIAQENTPLIPLTEEELADQKIIHKFDHGGWITEYDRKAMDKIYKEMEHKFFYGT